MEQRLFNIPAQHYDRLVAEVKKLSNRAKKIAGWEFDPLIAGIHYRDLPNGRREEIYEVNLDVMPIQIDGWEFVSRIDHSNPTGNVVRTVPHQTVGDHFRTVGSNCEHCGHDRKRRDTFVVRHQDGREMQVGSSCLIDFLGHDAARLGRIAEMAGYLNETIRHYRDLEIDLDHRGLVERRVVHLKSYLEYCARSVRLHGWVSAQQARDNLEDSTRTTAMHSMLMGDPIEPQDVQNAERAIAWARGFENLEKRSDYQHNALVIANTDIIENRSTGIAASIVGVFMKNESRKKAVVIQDMTALVTLFANANSKLKFPKIVIDLKNAGTVEMYRAGERSNAVGSINIKRQGYDGAWLGRIHTDGRFQPSSSAPNGIDHDLVEMAENPSQYAAHYGHKTGQCCFCNKKLKDERSVRVGYGKTCASNWSLPWA